jgi:hypothetical protein
MGGVAQQVPKVAKEIVKPVQQVAQSAGLIDKPAAPQAAPAAAAPQPAARAGVDVPAQAQGRDETAEAIAARRRARRGGRALLSEARLNPEAGVQTLGSGGSL